MDNFGDRMKGYEGVSKTRLTPKIPVMLRLDGRAFHSFCRSLEKPYDIRFHRCMWAAAKALCEDISGCQLAYVQSDEISLLVTDNASMHTQPWFDNEVQKMCSVAAGLCSVSFYKTFINVCPDIKIKRLPCFDARAWSLPPHEVSNAFLWRQRDAERNSLSMVAQSLYSHKELHQKGRASQHDLLHAKGVNWNNLPIPQRRGACIVRETYSVPNPSGSSTRSRWVVDESIPIFSTTEGRAYIERFVNPPV